MRRESVLASSSSLYLRHLCYLRCLFYATKNNTRKRVTYQLILKEISSVSRLKIARDAEKLIRNVAEQIERDAREASAEHVKND